MDDLKNGNFPWLHRAGTDSENLLGMVIVGIILFVNII